MQLSTHSDLKPRVAFVEKDYHPVTQQCLDEIGGKMSLGQLSEDQLRRKFVGMSGVEVMSESRTTGEL